MRYCGFVAPDLGENLWGVKVMLDASGIKSKIKNVVRFWEGI